MSDFPPAFCNSTHIHARTIEQPIQVDADMHAEILAYPRTLTQQEAFLFLHNRRTQFLAKASASPAGCLQAPLTLERFTGLWAKRQKRSSM